MSANARLIFGSKEPPSSLLNQPVTFLADHTVDYNRSFYGNTQQTTVARQALIAYYRRQLTRVLQAPAFHAPVGAPTATTDRAEEEGSSSDPNSSKNEPLVRVVGILTQLPEPHSIGKDRLAPWEFYAVNNVHDDDQLHTAFDALVSTSTLVGSGGDFQDYIPGRLALFCGSVARYTGLYPGVCVGVRGTVCRRDLEGRITSLLVKDIVTAPRPLYPWNVVSQTTASAPSAPLSSPQIRVPIRVQMATGPFPRRDMVDILTACIQNALHRQTDVLLLGGPFFPPFQDYEKTELALMKSTLEDQLSGLVDHIERVLSHNRAKNQRALKVLLVPSIQDLMQVPVLPQPMLSLALDDDSAVRTLSNPCRFSVQGVAFGFLNYDVLAEVQETMVEKLPTPSGNLQRVAESIVQSRMFCPTQQVPSPNVDLRHLGSLSLSKHAVQEQEIPASTDPESDAAAGMDSTSPAATTAVPEAIPHVLWMPSLKPEFSFCTHSRDQDLLGEAEGNGSLIINPQVWSKARNATTGYFLNVAEITIGDSQAVASFGVAEGSAKDVASGGSGVSVTLRTVTKM